MSKNLKMEVYLMPLQTFYEEFEPSDNEY